MNIPIEIFGNMLLGEKLLPVGILKFTNCIYPSLKCLKNIYFKLV